MYIKQVVIHGFKSYKNETICEPFDPGHNVIVGRNGSGKSNFFFAIRFVLSDMFSSLSNQERAKLLHGEGLGMAVMSAYVEITFDNADHRIPIERDEVTLRRTIGLKKDEYHLDTKHVSKQDVMNLLESSGFSRSNPYYIVQQGKITQLTLMKDAERLNLLKEVAGTKVYDERRAQSVQILEDTGSKKERIEEVLNYIEQRLAELEDEKEELKEYQDLDRLKRAIEYTIYDKELRFTREELERIDEERQAVAIEREKTHEKVDDDERTIASLTEELRKLKAERDKMARERAEIDEERKDRLSARAKLELEVSEAQAAIGDEKNAESRIQTELKSVRKEKAKKTAELSKVAPSLEAVSKEREEIVAAFEAAKRQQEELYAKQTRTSQFESVAERDAHIDDEVKSLRKVVSAKEKFAAHTKSEIERLRKAIEENKDEVEEQKQQIEERKGMIADIQTELVKMRATRDELQNERHDAWKKDAALDTRKNDLKKEVSEAERKLFSTTSKQMTKGVEAVWELQREQQLEGIYGPLYDLISCQASYRAPVEVTAGNQLFSVVVDTDETASRCIAYINNKKIDARVTFLPLNRLRQKPHNLPKSDDVIHMWRKVECDKKIQPAIYHVFGRTLVCRDLSIAATYASQHDVDTVTLDGDKVGRKGAMTGGFLDDKVSKLEMANKLRDLSKKFQTVNDEAEKMKVVIDDIDQKITQDLSLKKKRESDRDRLRSTLTEITKNIERLENQGKQMESQLADKEQQLAQLEKERAEAEQKVASLEAERGTDLDSQLATDDRETLRELTETIAELQPKLTELTKKEEALRKQHSDLINALALNLEKRERELLHRSETYQYEDHSDRLETKQSELQRATDALNEADERREELDKDLVTKKEEISEITAELDSARAEERKRVSSDADADKRLEKILSKRAQHLSKQDRLVKQIRELGALPKGFEDHSKTGLKKLYSQLAQVNKKLKDPKYRQVNKKALDQYVSFSEQRDALTGRKTDQDNADDSIQQLIQVLDNQKDEAIERTFKQVSKYFTEVFRELVPGGEAHLIMQKRMDQPGAAADGDGDDGEADEMDEDADAGSSDVESESSEDGVSASKKGKKGKGKAAKKSGKGKKAAKKSGKGKKKAEASPAVPTSRIENYVGVSVRVSFTGKETETQLLQQLSGGQKTIVALALIFAIQRCDPAPFYLFDEIDAALDAAYRVAVAEMIHRLSENAQFITTTFRPEMLQHANKFYGVTFHKKVSKIECVTRANAMNFLEDVKTT